MGMGGLGEGSYNNPNNYAHGQDNLYSNDNDNHQPQNYGGIMCFIPLSIYTHIHTYTHTLKPCPSTRNNRFFKRFLTLC